MEVLLTICCRINAIWVEVPLIIISNEIAWIQEHIHSFLYTLLYHENRVWEGYLPHKLQAAQTHLSSEKAGTYLVTHSSADAGINDNPTCGGEQCSVCCRRAHWPTSTLMPSYKIGLFLKIFLSWYVLKVLNQFFRLEAGQSWNVFSSNWTLNSTISKPLTCCR